MVSVVKVILMVPLFFLLYALFACGNGGALEGPGILEAFESGTPDSQKSSGRSLGLPAIARVHSPKHYDKANDYFERFEKACLISKRTTNGKIRQRAYRDMLMLASRTMKHIYQLQSHFPNDLTLDTAIHRARDFSEIYMHKQLERAAKASYDRNKENVYLLDNMSLHCMEPFGANYLKLMHA